MPELPEVETTKNAILPFQGKTLKRIIVNNPSLRWPINEKLINKIKDVKVLSISRRAKYIFLNLDEMTIIIKVVCIRILTELNELIPLNFAVTK